MSAAAELPATREPLDAVLGPAHDLWVEEVRRFLTPAATPSAPFWDRWSVVRYLNDQFQEHYRTEVAFVEELRSFAQPLVLERLRATSDRVARLRLALDRIGRRRGTAAEFSAMGEEFLKALELWCAEIEAVAHRIRVDDLTEDGRRLLELLEAAHRTIV
jgi:hypothetical protein